MADNKYDVLTEINAQIVYAINVLVAALCMDDSVDAQRLARRLRRSLKRIKPEREVTRKIVDMMATTARDHASTKAKQRR